MYRKSFFLELSSYLKEVNILSKQKFITWDITIMSNMKLQKDKL